MGSPAVLVGGEEGDEPAPMIVEEGDGEVDLDASVEDMDAGEGSEEDEGDEGMEEE